MKKLALAPAVAIAITGLAASPVIAAPSSADASTALSATQVQSAKDDPSDDEAETQKLDAKVSVSPQEISQSDLADKENGGVTVTVTGLEKGDVISDDVSFEEGETKTAEGDSLTYVIVNKTDDPEAIAPGPIDFTVTVKRGDEIQELDASFTVTEDEPEAPEADPKVTVKKDKLTESEFAKNGVTVSGEGFTPNGKVTLVGGSAQSAFGTTEVTADEDGKVSGALKSENELDPGEYSVWGVDQESEQTTDAVTVTITKDETEDPTTPAAEAKLTVSPESIKPADFVKKDKGVTLAVENCEPGKDVRFLVNPKGESNVTAFDKTIKADDEGKANVNVYGTSASNASAYIGDYDVTVTCGDDELTGDFSVEKDPNAGGGDDGNGDGGNGGDNGNGGGDLPRTGTELTGLVGGAGLLLIGGVAVAMTMRRKKVAQDPSEI